MPTYRAAIIGLSWISADPAGDPSDPVLGTAIPYSHASALAAIAGVEVVAGCDVSADARDEFVTRWGARWPGLRVYERFEDLLAAERPELVCVVTPDHLHVAVVVAAIANGARAIFCEKPLATSPGEAWRMVEAVRGAGIPVNVNYTYRFRPEWNEARRLVRAGAIGRLSQVVIQSGGARAMLWRNHTHTIDWMTFFADSDPSWVFAELEPGYEGYGTVYKGDGGRDPDTEPAFNAYVAFENGVRGFLTGLKTNAEESAVHLIGPEGRITLDLEGLRVISTPRVGSRTPVPGASGPQVLRPQAKWSVAGMQAGIQDLITALETGRPVHSPVDEAYRTVLITDAILRSQAQGNAKVAITMEGPPS